MKFWRLLLALPHRLKGAFLEPRNQTIALLTTVAAATAQVLVLVLPVPIWVESSYTFFQAAILMPLAVFVGAAATPKRGSAIETLMRRPRGCEAPFLLAAAAHLYSRCDDRRAARMAILELAKELADIRTEQRYLPQIAQAVTSRCVWAVCGRKTDDAADGFWQANEKSFGARNTIERIFIPPRNAQEEVAVAVALERHLTAGMTVRAFGSHWNGSDVLFKWQLPEGFGMTLIGRRPDSPDENPKLDRVLVHWGFIGEKVPHHGVILTSQAWTEYFWDLFQQMAAAAPQTPAGSLPEFLQAHPNYRLRQAAV